MFRLKGSVRNSSSKLAKQGQCKLTANDKVRIAVDLCIVVLMVENFYRFSFYGTETS